MRTKLFILLVAAGVLACTDRRESVARQELSERINSESKAAFGLARMIKTNGFEHERDGMKLYTMEWEATLEVRTDGWKNGWRDYRVLSSEPNAFAAAVEGSSVRRVLKGGTILLHGKSEMQKADRGWRVLDSTVTASRVHPPPEVAGFVGAWHLPARGEFFRIEYDDSHGLGLSTANIAADGRVSWVNTRPARIVDGALVIQYEEGSGTFTKVSQNEIVSTDQDAFGERREEAVRVDGRPEDLVTFARAAIAGQHHVKPGVAVSVAPSAFGLSSNSQESRTFGTTADRGGAQVRWTLPDHVAFLWQRQIAPQDLLGLDKTELKRLRNFIYARHGRAFASQDLREFFEHQAWYRVNPSYTDAMLSPIERANVATIARLENERP